MTMQGLTQRVITTQFHAQNNVNVLPRPALSPVMNPIKHVLDRLGRRVRSNQQMNAINDSNMHLC